MSNSSPSEARLLKTSMASASSLMALQLLSRVFTFALNQALFRLASPSAFGAAAIQFELILSTILFLSREGVRNAVLRVNKNQTLDSTIKRMNLSFLPSLVGIPLSFCTCFLYIHYAGQEILQEPHFRSATMLYALSAVIELLSEPLYNVVMVELKTGVRVRAEGLGITAKSVVTFLILFYDSRAQAKGNLALLAFAFGQLVYGMVMLAVYVAYLGKGYLYPKRPATSGKSLLDYIDQETLHLSFTMTLQSLVKHFLTEGDKLILSWYSPLHDQGGYAIAVNYGSLIARIIFQPVEESLRVYFSRVLGGTTEKETQERQASLAQSANALNSLLSIQTSLSVILTVFGSAYISILLPLLLPNQYLSTSAPRVLAAWVWYIPFLAINGGLEAFLSSVATSKNLNDQSRWMIGFSMIYIISAIFLYRQGFGDSSLVYANIVNLSVRIIYSLHFITNFFKTSAHGNIFDWTSSLPPWQLLAVSLASILVINISDARFKASAVITTHPGRLLILFNPSVLIHVSIGVLSALFCLSTWWMTSGRYLRININRQKTD